MVVVNHRRYNVNSDVRGGDPMGVPLESQLGTKSIIGT